MDVRFAGLGHQDRTRRSAYDFFGDAASKETFEGAGQAMCPQNNKVTRFVGSDTRYFRGGVAFGQEVFDFYVGRWWDMPLEITPKTSLVPGRFQLAGCFAEGHVGWPQRFHHMENEQPRVMLPGQVDSHVEGKSRVSRIVGRVQDAARCKHGSVP